MNLRAMTYLGKDSFGQRPIWAMTQLRGDATVASH